MIKWEQLLEKFKAVQDRARRAQRLMSGGSLDDSPDLNGLRLTDGAGGGDGAQKPSRPPGVPPATQKDVAAAAAAAAPPPAAAPKRSSGLGRQFGRLGGAVSGRTRRSQG